MFDPCITFSVALPCEKLSDRRLATEVSEACNRSERRHAKSGEKPGFLWLALSTGSQTRRNIAFTVGSTPKADQLTLSSRGTCVGAAC